MNRIGEPKDRDVGFFMSHHWGRVKVGENQGDDTCGNSHGLAALDACAPIASACLNISLPDFQRPRPAVLRRMHHDWMTSRQLQNKFTYMFEGPHIDLSFHRGWFPLFVKLCEDIDMLLGGNTRGFHWIQLKEKFGSARFYWAMDDAKPLHMDIMQPGGVLIMTLPPEDGGEVAAAIHARVEKAAAATRTLCIYCGEQGESDTDQGWVLVVCPKHRALRAGEMAKLRAWLEDDEDVQV